MEMWNKIFWTSNDPVLTWIRVCLGLVILPHGLQKVFGLFGGGGIDGTLVMFSHLGIPPYFGLLAIAAESLGAIALIFGFLGRVAALAIAVEMLVAIYLLHFHNGFFMNWTGAQAGEGFEYHLLAIGLAAATVIKGAGAFSVDREITLILDRHRTQSGRHLRAA
jgi:putative oxidoreductase